MAGHRPRGVFHAFRLLLIIAVVATLLAAAARLPAAPAAPPAQHAARDAAHGQTEDAAPETAVTRRTETDPAAMAEAGRPRPPQRETATNTRTGQPDSDALSESEAKPAVQRAPRTCTGAIPFARAAAAGEALVYLGTAATPEPDALGGLEPVLEAYLATLNGTYGVAVTDLATGATAAVRGDQVFVAASTFKVPLAMYVFSLVERGEADLAEPVYYVPEDWEGGTGVLHAAIPGDCYTVAELVDLSLTVSDNIATNMLLRHFGDENVFAYMRELGGAVTNLATGRRATTPRDMARYMELAYRRAAEPDGELYRILMGLLTQTVFTDRIAAGAPAGVPVAHKIGTLPAMVHDIGVVFLPERPFAIAIFSSGVNEAAAAVALADITRIVSAYMQGGAELAAQVAGSAASAAAGGGSEPGADTSTGADPASADGPPTGADPASADGPPAGADPASPDGPPAGADTASPDGPPAGVDPAPPDSTSAGADPASPDGTSAGGTPTEAGADPEGEGGR